MKNQTSSISASLENIQAAAPELLDAAERALRGLIYLRKLNLDTFANNYEICLLEQAIAKAKGE